MRGSLAWREEAAGLPPATTSKAASAPPPSCKGVRSGLTQKVRPEKGEERILDKTLPKASSGQLSDLGSALQRVYAQRRSSSLKFMPFLRYISPTSRRTAAWAPGGAHTERQIQTL